MSCRLPSGHQPTNPSCPVTPAVVVAACAPASRAAPKSAPLPSTHPSGCLLSSCSPSNSLGIPQGRVVYYRFAPGIPGERRMAAVPVRERRWPGPLRPRCPRSNPSWRAASRTEEHNRPPPKHRQAVRCRHKHPWGPAPDLGPSTAVASAYRASGASLPSRADAQADTHGPAGARRAPRCTGSPPRPGRPDESWPHCWGPYPYSGFACCHNRAQPSAGSGGQCNDHLRRAYRAWH